MNWPATVQAMTLSSRRARTHVAGRVFAILSVPVVGNRAMAESTATQEQPGMLEKAKRIEVVRGGGYFPTLIRLTDGTLAEVVWGSSPHKRWRMP